MKMQIKEFAGFTGVSVRSENYYLCTNQILAGLGQMYVADERFKSNIDKHADGTAEFICEAIEIYCRK